jgi:hypothetical protein
MREQNSLLRGSPDEKRFIVNSRQTRVLCANNVDGGATPEQRAEKSRMPSGGQ